MDYTSHFKRNIWHVLSSVFYGIAGTKVEEPTPQNTNLNEKTGGSLSFNFHKDLTNTVSRFRPINGKANGTSDLKNNLSNIQSKPNDKAKEEPTNGVKTSLDFNQDLTNTIRRLKSKEPKPSVHSNGYAQVL